ncbi:MAG TPA: hypothetical protein PK482_00975 [Spirochaetota bacterium]|nr:hypothetical protein [Spirochaetota bacterium]
MAPFILIIKELCVFWEYEILCKSAFAPSGEFRASMAMVWNIPIASML